MGYRMLNNGYYAALSEKIMKKYRVANDTLKMLCEKKDEDFPKKEILQTAIADLSLQYNSMMNEIIAILDLVTNTEKSIDYLNSKSNRLIEEIAGEISKDINENFELQSFLSPMGQCNFILIKNTMVLYVKDDLKFRLEYSTPEKARDMYYSVYAKLAQYSA